MINILKNRVLSLWRGDEESLRNRLKRSEQEVYNWSIAFDLLQDEHKETQSELSKLTVVLILVTAGLIVSVIVNCWFIFK
jgi:hypothetical protein